MPGIHIRTIGPFDGFSGHNEDALTVPGSYWLCHKKNIYKFTFRYHRTIRNKTVAFTHGKELMKVIRRIIKNQPPQGQQFSTRHLHITFNHSSWTRQDKMFAMVKFKDRPDASAYSLAFILTVIVLDDPETLKDTRRKDASSFLRNDAKSIIHIPSPESIVGNRRNVEPLEAEEMSKADKNDIHSKIELNLRNDFAETAQVPGRDLRRRPFSLAKAVNLRMSQNPESIVGETSKKTENIESASMEREIEIIPSLNQVKVGSSKEKNLQSTLVLSDVEKEISKEEAEEELSEVKLEVPSSSTNSDSKAKPPELEETVDVNSNETKNQWSSEELDEESTSLPYQYFIEKDIEKTRSRIRPCVFFPNIKEVMDILEPIQASDGKESDSDKRESMKVDGKKSPCEETANINIPPSSDITDLVMEGLMFTIRQGKDSVTVEEQKTKLEMDEVLENSVKVETKKGEKCLLNSSLLRLENLITRIEVPVEGSTEESKPLENQNITGNLSVIEVDEKRMEICASVPPEKSENSETSEGSLEEEELDVEDEDEDEDIKLELKDDSSDVELDDEEEEKEEVELELARKGENLEEEEPEEKNKGNQEEEEEDEDEDIIPEVLQQSDDLNDSIIELQAEMDYENLLMDDLEDDSQLKPLPRVISNTLISENEIPLILQRALRTNFLNRQRQMNPETEESDLSVSSSRLEANSEEAVDLEANSGKGDERGSKISESFTPEKVEGMNSSLVNSIISDSNNSNNNNSKNCNNISNNSSDSLKTNELARKRRRIEEKEDDEEEENDEPRFKTLKLVQDLMRDARVVVERISVKSIPRILQANSSLATYIH